MATRPCKNVDATTNTSYIWTCTATTASQSDFYALAPNKRLKIINEKEEKKLKKSQRGF